MADCDERDLLPEIGKPLGDAGGTSVVAMFALEASPASRMSKAEAHTQAREPQREVRARANDHLFEPMFVGLGVGEDDASVGPGPPTTAYSMSRASRRTEIEQ